MENNPETSDLTTEALTRPYYNQPHRSHSIFYTGVSYSILRWGALRLLGLLTHGRRLNLGLSLYNWAFFIWGFTVGPAGRC